MGSFGACRVSTNILLSIYNPTPGTFTECIDGRTSSAIVIRSNTDQYKSIVDNGSWCKAERSASSQDNPDYSFYISIEPVNLLHGWNSQPQARTGTEETPLKAPSGFIMDNIDGLFDIHVINDDGTVNSTTKYGHLMLPGQKREGVYNSAYKMSETDVSFSYVGPAGVITIEKQGGLKANVTANSICGFEQVALQAKELNSTTGEIYRVFEKKCTVFNVGVSGSAVRFGSISNPQRVDLLSADKFPAQLRDKGKIRVRISDGVTIKSSTGQILLPASGTSVFTSELKNENGILYVDLTWDEYQKYFLGTSNYILAGSDDIKDPVLSICYVPEKEENESLAQKSSSSKVELLTLDHMIHGIIRVPSGVEDVNVSLYEYTGGNTTAGVKIAEFENLLYATENGEYCVYNGHDDIFSEKLDLVSEEFYPPLPEAIQKRISQRVLVIKDENDPQIYHFYTLFDQYNTVELRATFDGETVSSQKALTSHAQFKEWIDFADDMLGWKVPNEGTTTATTTTTLSKRTALAKTLAGEYEHKNLVCRALYGLMDIYLTNTALSVNIPISYVRGIFEGFFGGLRDDVNGIIDAAGFFRHPIQRSAELYNTIKEIAKNPKVFRDEMLDLISNSLDSFLSNADKQVIWRQSDLVVDLSAKAYMCGYISGYIAEQVLVGYIGAGIAAKVGKVIKEILELSRVGKLVVKGISAVNKCKTAITNFAAKQIGKVAGATVSMIKDEMERVGQMLQKLDKKILSGTGETYLQRLSNTYDSWADKISKNFRDAINGRWDDVGEKTLTDVVEGNNALKGENIPDLTDGEAVEYMVERARTPDVEAADLLITDAENMWDVKNAGLKNWKDVEKYVGPQIESRNPGKKVGSQITVEVFYYDNAGIERSVRIKPDYVLEEIAGDGTKSYKLIDVKTNQHNDLADLSATPSLHDFCTKNQKEAFPRINVGQGQPNGYSRAVIRGKKGYDKFKIQDVEIVLQDGIDFYVNAGKQFNSIVKRSF